VSVLTILASARPHGHAARLLTAILSGRPAHQLSLLDLTIRDYQYHREADGDDFLPLVHDMLRADRILLVTPVYWYAMSAPLKRLFDRFSDLITVRKDLGRRLAGRTLYLAACGADPDLPDGFEVPFRSTAHYFDMAYGGAFYAVTTDQAGPSPASLEAAARFGDNLFP